MEILKGLGILDPSFYVPVIVVAVIIFIIAKVAKSLLKLAVLIAVVALAAIIYMNLPSFKVENGMATLNFKGHAYSASVKDTKIITEQVDGDTQTILVSGTTRIKLPFSKSFADKFITDKLNEK